MAAITFTDSDVKPGSANAEFAPVGVAGAAISRGQAIYQKTSDGQWYPANATDDTKPAAGESVAISLTSAGIGQTVAYLNNKGAKIDFGAGVLTPTMFYVVGLSDGAIAPVSDLGAGNALVKLGYASSDSELIIGAERTGITQ